MAFDASPTELQFHPPPLVSVSSPSPSHYFSPGRHFYVAVDKIHFKMETLVDLLGVTGQRPNLPIAVCCSSRDELDALCSVVSNLSYISLSILYSDLSESERGRILGEFRQKAIEWNQNISHPSNTIENENSEQKSNMIVVTDACLPIVASGEQPILARILINFELPTKKETYLRRMSTCLEADGIVINMVVGGEVVTLKSLEESLGFIIAEMPINIFDIL
ncbi:hypothetical protein ZOSMA_68G00660 [Zostera marina]|uniref:Eukaryotic initiation factor 4A n=1 Tax=Zostera marina TaxID=29655 RepID=A0A0K9NRS1_ZOSMR|nr:hypothetical protein ZOSMA_68G00660 [Zostera marina]